MNPLKELDQLTTNALIALQNKSAGGKILLEEHLNVCRLHEKARRKLRNVHMILEQTYKEYQAVINH